MVDQMALAKAQNVFPGPSGFTKPPQGPAVQDKKGEVRKEEGLDPIKAQVKELLDSKPLTLELINGSSLPEEVKTRLIHDFENGIKPSPRYPEKDLITNLLIEKIEPTAATFFNTDLNLRTSDTSLIRINDLITNPKPIARKIIPDEIDVDFTGDGRIDHNDSLVLMRHMMGTFPGESINKDISKFIEPVALKQRLSKVFNDSISANSASNFGIDNNKQMFTFSDGMYFANHIQGQGNNHFPIV